MIHIVKKESVCANDVDWNKLTPQLYNSIDISMKDSILAIIPAVEKMFNALDDEHGQIHYNDKTYFGINHLTMHSKNYSYILSAAHDEKYAFRTKIFNEDYGYISVPAQVPNLNDSTTNNPQKLMVAAMEMAQIFNDSLCKLMKNNIKGLIIDLRLNFGGSSVIAINELSSVIGNGNILFYAGKKDTSSVSLINGAYYVDSILIGKMHNPCKISNIKIAVLLSNVTGSAGEHTAIALKGRKNTKFFGERTAGYTTTNEEVFFNKNLYLAFSVGNVLDRNALSYKKGVDPDVNINGGDNFENLQKDSKIIAALRWLKDN